MKVTIIIVTFRSDNVIEGCLSKINKKYPEIIIENSNNRNLKKKLKVNFQI